LPLAAHAGPDAYVGASIGNARLDDNFGGFGIDSEADSYRFFGGLQFGDTFGIEAGYLNFGDFTESVDLGGLLSRTDINGDGWTLGATLALKTCRYSARAGCSSGMLTFSSMGFRSRHPETTILTMAAA